MSPLPDPVVLLQQALLLAENYFAVPDNLRSECKAFLDLAATIDPDDAHSMVRVESAYQRAFPEAASLVAAGSLAINPEHPLPPDGRVPNVAAQPYAEFFGVQPENGTEHRGKKYESAVDQEPATEVLLELSPRSEILTTVADPASEITRLHEEIGASFRMSLERAIRIGDLLTQQKTLLGHGKFLPWVRQELPFSERTAQNYMRVYAKRDELKSATVADLAGAYKLAATGETKPERPEAPERQHKLRADDGTNLAGNSASQAPCQHQADCQKEDHPRVSAAVKAETVNVGASDLHRLAQHEGDVSPYPPSTAEQQPTPAVQMSFSEAFGVLVRAVRAKGPNLARRAIEQLGVEAKLNVFVPLEADPAGNLMLLEDIVAEQLAAAEPRHARQWVRSLGSLLSDHEDEDADDDDDDDFD